MDNRFDNDPRTDARFDDQSQSPDDGERRPRAYQQTTSLRKNYNPMFDGALWLRVTFAVTLATVLSTIIQTCSR